ncbi:Fc.00g046500.m01.CDS01 [Cosmosporella sp. VM-42]
MTLRLGSLGRHFGIACWQAPPSSPRRVGRLYWNKESARFSSTSSKTATPTAHQAAARVLQSVPLPILLRSLLVLSVAALPQSLLSVIIRTTKKYSQKLSSSSLLRWAVEKTFYNTFCIGDEKPSIRSNIKELRSMGLSGVILAFARETKFGGQTSGGKLTKDEQQLREWVAMNLETLESLTSDDFLALRCTGAGAASVSAFDEFVQSDPGSKEYEAALEQLGVYEDALAEICAIAQDKNVKVLIDAESSRHQAAIDHVALRIMSKFNRNGKALVYNTFQMYLQRSTAKMIQQIQVSRDQGFTIGIKMVRGAFLHGEPDMSIIHTSKQDTDDSYDDGVRFLFGGDLEGKGQYKDTIASGAKSLSEKGAKAWNAEIMLATHNLASVQKALSVWRNGGACKNVPNTSGGTVQSLAFAQLMGMADEVSLRLVSDIKGHNSKEGKNLDLPSIGVYKYTIWGSFEECLLYLLRRAEENQDAVARTRGTAWEVLREIGRRVVPFSR